MFGYIIDPCFGRKAAAQRDADSELAGSTSFRRRPTIGTRSISYRVLI